MDVRHQTIPCFLLFFLEEGRVHKERRKKIEGGREDGGPPFDGPGLLFYSVQPIRPWPGLPGLTRSCRWRGLFWVLSVQERVRLLDTPLCTSVSCGITRGCR